MVLAIEALQRQGIGLWLPLLMACHAEAEAEAGHHQTALAILTDAFAVSNRTGQRWYDAELYRISGDTYLGQEVPDFAAAEASFSRAIEVARDQRACSFELRATLALAKLRQATNRRDEARNLLVSALSSCPQSSQFADFDDAQNLLLTLTK